MDHIERRVVPAGRDGIGFAITVHPDPDASPYDHADEDTDRVMLAAWVNREWGYVGVVVTPTVDGVELPMCAESTWGVEYGSCAQWSREVTLDVVCDDYAAAMFDECRYQVQVLLRRLLRTLRP